MIVQLQNSTLAEVVYGAHLQQKPRWGLRDLSLIAGPYFSGDEHEQHFLQTTGSGNWYRSEFDELRFGQDDKLLKSMWFRVPESNFFSPDFMSEWQTEEPVEGLLRLISSEAFQLIPTVSRWMEPSGDLLACTYSEAPKMAEKLRLRVAEDLDLLFADQQLYGWLLSKPVRYLVNFWELPEDKLESESELQLAELLYQYLGLVEEAHIEQMEERDITMQNALIKLSSMVRSDRGVQSQQKVFCNSINDILEQFYGETF